MAHSSTPDDGLEVPDEEGYQTMPEYVTEEHASKPSSELEPS
jgi:hypothetical protein